ncbi:hypothetical protein [Curtobacterium sp. PhB130]|uniref:hypothetical protein n=1 Tax=Curtobacterium sp. PhB130 TaxID=2485178 RepID=UPI0011CDF27D|nr:hypothetical protein [Curtobacterium sp. PhB130]
MTKESESRRRLILDRIGTLPLDTLIYRAPKDGRSEVERRAQCIDALVTDLAAAPASLLCFERDETLVARDRRRVVEASHRIRQPIEHRHASATDEPLLAIPDALAWAWARGGPWRRRCRGTSERRPSV